LLNTYEFVKHPLQPNEACSGHETKQAILKHISQPWLPSRPTCLVGLLPSLCALY